MNDSIRRQAYGNVRPILHANERGDKVVVVGDRLLNDSCVPHHMKWKTFPNFLICYLQGMFGGGFRDAEVAKLLAERHPVIQWFNHFWQQAQTTTCTHDEFRAFETDGISAAFLYLAYDLFVLRNHDKLQEQVLRRLRRADQFFGARYELFVAATSIRAGFDIAYEDETDTSKKHPEFVAVHRATRFTLAVEAKAKHRFDGTSTKLGVKHLLLNAAKKSSQLPYAVFVEINLPPSQRHMAPDWVPEVDQTVNELGMRPSGLPFHVMFFTNVQHQHGEPGGENPWPEYCSRAASTSQIPEPLHAAIVRAIPQYANVPQRFPKNYMRKPGNRSWT